MKKFIVFAVFSIFTNLIYSQSAEKISQILETQKITFAQAAYLANCANPQQAEVSESDAFLILQEDGIINKKFAENDEIELQQYCNILAKTYNVRGSLFLKMFKNPRYAFRQMKADETITKNADPNQKITGREALYILTNCIENYDNEQ